MALVKEDLFRFFWEQPVLLAGLMAFLAGPVAIYVIEFGRALFNPTRPPWGLAIFRWASVWLGDSLLALAIGVIALYYSRVLVEDSIWTGRGFSIFSLLLGLALSIGFIIFEESVGIYPTELKININRVYHFFYFAWMAGMLVGATRIIGYGVVGGQERGLALAAALLVFLYFITVGIDALDKSPLWHLIQHWYPEQTRNP